MLLFEYNSAPKACVIDPMTLALQRPVCKLCVGDPNGLSSLSSERHIRSRVKEGNDGSSPHSIATLTQAFSNRPLCHASRNYPQHMLSSYATRRRVV
jgi:hypothetical protein